MSKNDYKYLIPIGTTYSTLGTMIGFIAFGEYPDIGDKVKTFSALAPVATVGHIKGGMKVLSYATAEIEVKLPSL